MQPIGIGTSLVLIAVGAILHWAVTAHVSGVNIQTIGLILLIVGILGLILTFILAAVLNDRRRAVVDDRPVARERDIY